MCEICLKLKIKTMKRKFYSLLRTILVNYFFNIKNFLCKKTNKQTKKKTIEKLENFSGPFVTFQYRPSRRRRIQKRYFNFLSADLNKMIKQTQTIHLLLATNCLSGFHHFVGLAMKCNTV